MKKPRLQALAEDEGRFAAVTSLGVDEHTPEPPHHADTGTRGPKELAGMVDLTRDRDVHGSWRLRAGLLDLVPGRSNKAYADWLAERGAPFRDGVQVAALDPFGGDEAALDTELTDATAVLDAFHVVKLGTQVVDEVRRRVQQATTRYRGREGDLLLGIRTALRAGAENPPTSSYGASRTRPSPTSRTRRSTSPGAARRTCARPTVPRTPPTDAGAPRRSSTRSTPARSVRSPGWDGPCAAGGRRSWPASAPTVRTTAAPKPWASSSCTAVSPAAAATATASACSWLPGDSPHDPHRMSEEPSSGASLRPTSRSRSSSRVHPEAAR